MVRETAEEKGEVSTSGSVGNEDWMCRPLRNNVTDFKNWLEMG